MRIQYFKSTDTLYIEFSRGSIVETRDLDEDTVIDLGFNYLVSKQSIPAGTSCNVNCSGIDSVVYNPYADLNVETTVKAYVMALTYTTSF